MPPQPPRPDLAEVCRWLAQLGGYFALPRASSSSPVLPEPGAQSGWLPFAQLPVDLLVRRTRSALAGMDGRPIEQIEFRPAASITHLGLVARVVSPVFGASAGLGAAPRLEVGALRCSVLDGGPLPLQVVAGTVVVEVEAAVQAVLNGPVALLEQAFAQPGADGRPAVSRRVLRGNLASAVNGAHSQFVRNRPGSAGAAAGVAAALLGSGVAAGSYVTVPRFRRRNCCLIYRLQPESVQYCGDCVLG